MQNLFLVMLGGALGAGARFGVGRFTLGHFGSGYPWGTVIVNLVGGLLMGLLIGIAARGETMPEAVMLFFGVGILGGFTTFSAFSLDMVNMVQAGNIIGAFGYVLLSVLGAAVALFLGLSAAKVLT